MLTALELAAAIVRTVRRHPDLSDVKCAAEVFDLLHSSSVWFCRCSEDEAGLSVETPMERATELPAIVAAMAALKVRVEELEALRAAAEATAPRRRRRGATPAAGETVDLTPGCDCDHAGTPDAAVHALDCTWIARRIEVQNGG